MVLVQLGLHFLLRRHADNSAGSSIFCLCRCLLSLLLPPYHSDEQAQTPTVYALSGHLIPTLLGVLLLANHIASAARIKAKTNGVAALFPRVFKTSSCYISSSQWQINILHNPYRTLNYCRIYWWVRLNINGFIIPHYVWPDFLVWWSETKLHLLTL